MLEQKKHLILIGFMGSGKTTLGKRLANQLKMPFVDSDDSIEKRTGIKIEQIFETHGESFFRELEKKWLLTLGNLQPSVIATGGGLPCFDRNLEALKESGKVFYLQRPARELAQRLSVSKTNRPLILNLTSEELVQFIEEKIIEREVFYLQADFILDRDEQMPNVIKKIFTNQD